MLQYAKYPESMFTGSPATLTELREGIRRLIGR